MNTTKLYNKQYDTGQTVTITQNVMTQLRHYCNVFQNPCIFELYSYSYAKPRAMPYH